MSTDHDSSPRTREQTVRVDTDGTVDQDVFRLLALGCVLILTASYVHVLREVTRVVGGTRSLFILVGGMLLAATVLAWAIRPRTATLGALVAGLVGFGYYLETSGVGVELGQAELQELLVDTITLVTGLPLLRMVEAGVWTLGFAPAPVFLSWYLAVRGRYGLSVVPGVMALVFLVLTGDAGSTITLIGMLGAIGALGFGELARRGGSIAQVDLLAVLFAIIIVLSLSVSFVPSGPTNPTTAGSGGEGTLEGTIDSASDRSAIGGQVDLSPEVRFTVESEQRSYWRTGIYDRFTGDEWVRTGQDQAAGERIAEPPGEYERVNQHVTAETELGVLPTAPQPMTVDGDIVEHASVSMHGQIRPETPLIEGDSYVVESAVVDPNPSELQAAGTDYPDEVREHYLQTPEGTSDEFEERTAEITDDAETPYETATAIEQHLRTSKGYSLDVEQPRGNVAEEFLFEMDEGYCVYFATAMTQMLRAEDVPARYVTGYTSGQEVDDDTYVVRGLDAHAWVEVYFPDQGWVTFEPTPGDERSSVHDEHLAEARDDGVAGIDTDASEDVPVSEHEDEDDDLIDPEPGEQENQSPPDQQGPDEPDSTNESDEFDQTPPGVESDDSTDEAGSWIDRGDVRDLVTITRETAALVAVLLIGLVAGVHRTSAAATARHTVGTYWHGRRRDPDRDAERAYRRLERLLAREYRPRRRNESARAYLTDLSTTTDDGLACDQRLQTVLEYYERSVYGGGVDREEADEAVAVVDDVARSRLPLLGRLRS
ncbi:transglutaminaseTgpA domain-containing protein [Natrialbaceae archaeon A-arb3/5]